ncbi:Plasmid mobilization relaxosome protein MobC, partial [Dysosmobacter welbionis]
MEIAADLYGLPALHYNKVLIRNFTPAHHVGGACQIKAGDMGVDPLRIDHQAAAGHIHLYAVAGDFALQSQHGHHRSGASAAGIGEVLHAAFKCPLENQIFTGDLVEVHIGTLGKDL